MTYEYNVRDLLDTAVATGRTRRVFAEAVVVAKSRESLDAGCVESYLTLCDRGKRG